MRLILSFILFISLIPKLKSQELNLLTIEINDSINISKSSRKVIEKRINNISSELKARELISLLHNEGNIEATLDSLHDNSIKLTIGSKYYWRELKRGNMDEDVIGYIRFRERNYSGKEFKFNETKKILNQALIYYENSGYPFAQIKLDSINIREDKSISASISLVKNKKIYIDSLNIIGSQKINPTFLYNYIGIKPGDSYNESQVKRINLKLKELPFLKVTKSPEIVFERDFTKLNLFVEDKKASQFNGILGILPDNTDPQRILFTGDAFIKLQNALAKGEIIELNWKKLQNLTQDLKINLVYPFLFSTPFGIDYKLYIYKRDTTFLNVNNIIGVQYRLIGGNYFKAFFNNKSSSLLSTQKNLISNPNIIDVKAKLYGIEIKKENFDYKFNPRKGYFINILGSAGIREIVKNASINPEFYKNLDLKTTQYISEAEFGLFIPLFNQATVKFSSQSAIIKSKQIFNNELFRFGGLKTLRGFDEESIFASSFSILTFELRYLLDQNSYVHVFSNGGWYEDASSNNYIKDTPFGFGAGISFESKPGIFSINYALGKQFQNPIEFRSGKIHFGFVNYF